MHPSTTQLRTVLDFLDANGVHLAMFPFPQAWVRWERRFSSGHMEKKDPSRCHQACVQANLAVPQSLLGSSVCAAAPRRPAETGVVERKPAQSLVTTLGWCILGVDSEQRVHAAMNHIHAPLARSAMYKHTI